MREIIEQNKIQQVDGENLIQFRNFKLQRKNRQISRIVKREPV